MARLNVLEYPAEFLRGWPHGEAVEMNYPSTAQLGNGDVVVINNASQFEHVTAAATSAAQALPGAMALVARGQNDTFSQGGTGRGNLYTQVVPNIGIMSNYVVRTSKVSTATPPAMGQGLCLIVEGGELVWSTTTGVTNYYAAPDASLLEVETGLTDADGNALAVVAVILVK